MSSMSGDRFEIRLMTCGSMQLFVFRRKCPFFKKISTTQETSFKLCCCIRQNKKGFRILASHRQDHGFKNQSNHSVWSFHVLSCGFPFAFLIKTTPFHHCDTSTFTLSIKNMQNRADRLQLTSHGVTFLWQLKQN